MIGMATHSPAVLGIVIDRSKFRTIIIGESNLNSPEVNKFLKRTSNRIKVAMFDGFSVLEAIAGKYDLKGTKIVVYDTIVSLVKNEVPILDADVGKGDNNFIFKKVTPDMFNTAILKDKTGFTIIKPKKDTVPMAEELDLESKFQKLIKRVTKGLSQRKVQAFEEVFIEYIVSITSKKAFTKICSDFDIDKSLVEKAANFVTTAYGEGCFQAYHDIAFFKTDIKKAARDAKISLPDLEFMTEILLPKPDYSYTDELGGDFVESRKKELRKNKSKAKEEIQQDEKTKEKKEKKIKKEKKEKKAKKALESEAVESELEEEKELKKIPTKKRIRRMSKEELIDLVDEFELSVSIKKKDTDESAAKKVIKYLRKLKRTNASDDSELTKEDLSEMNRAALLDYIGANDLDIKTDKLSDKEIRAAILKVL